MESVCRGNSTVGSNPTLSANPNALIARSTTAVPSHPGGFTASPSQTPRRAKFTGNLWWDSIVVMRRIARAGTIVAVVGLSVGMLTVMTNLFVAALAFFFGAAGVVCAMFAWFRAEHLDELEELRRSQ